MTEVRGRCCAAADVSKPAWHSVPGGLAHTRSRMRKWPVRSRDRSRSNSTSLLVAVAFPGSGARDTHRGLELLEAGAPYLELDPRLEPYRVVRTGGAE